MSAIDKYRSLKGAVMTFLGQGAKQQVPETPKADEDPQKTHEYVQDLFDEGLKFESDHFADTAHLRLALVESNAVASSVTGTSPEGHRRACDQLASNNLWDVVGHRNTGMRDKWKSEEVEGLTQRNMRIRGSYISSAWHDITITPNINYIADIFNQERMAIGWSDFVDEYRELAQKYGIATARIYFEDDEDGGHVRVAVIRPGTITRTPNSMSFAERDGAWYAIQGTMINNKQLKKFYPNIEGAQASNVLSNKFNPVVTTKGDYANTKMYAKLECFMDDDTLEDRPVTQEENDELTAEIESLTMGNPVESYEGQNGKLHVQAKNEALSNFLSSIDETKMTEEDANFATRVIDAFTQNIDEHTQAMDAGDLSSLGLQKKYPFGRYICSVGGQIDADIPNPNKDEQGNGVPWRKLFEELKNEKVYGRIDGRGDPEIYFQDEKAASKAMSQFSDTVTLSMPKRYRHIQDKMNKKTESQEEDNDPTRVGYYTVSAPQQIEGKVSEASLTKRGIVVDKSERSQGINSISIGGEPDRQTSGFQTQLLQKQNETQVSGELDRNMRVAIENIVENMLGMYKVYYKERRQYNINGTKRYFNVSRMLSSIQAIDEEGQLVDVQNPKFEITAKPFSNYPNRFETELAQLSEIYERFKDENGVPMIPASALYDVLAMKYPQAEPNGEWRRMSEATKIGMQVMQQQQQEQEAAQKKQKQLEGAMESVDRGMIVDQYKQQLGLDGPSTSINFKDLPPSGQVQLAREAGLDISEDAVKKHIASQKPKPQNGNGAKNVKK